MPLQKKWAAVTAGGFLQTAWSKKDKIFYAPLFSYHDTCSLFWHGKTDERKAWAITRVVVDRYTVQPQIAQEKNDR